MLFFCVVPALIFLGLVGVGIYCLWTEARDRKAGRQPVFHHPDCDLPLYNRGHCDRYSVGTFFW